MTLGMPSIPLTVLVLIGVGSPALLLAVLGVASLVNRPLPERWTGLLAASSMATACGALTIAFIVYGITRPGTQLLSYGTWSSSHVVAAESTVDLSGSGRAEVHTSRQCFGEPRGGAKRQLANCHEHQTGQHAQHAGDPEGQLIRAEIRADRTSAKRRE